MNRTEHRYEPPQNTTDGDILALLSKVGSGWYVEERVAHIKKSWFKTVDKSIFTVFKHIHSNVYVVISDIDTKEQVIAYLHGLIDSRIYFK